MNSKGSTKKAMRFLSLLLAAFLFLEAQGFTVFAETVSGNEAAATEGGEQEIPLDSNVSENNAIVGAGTPANPVHHCTNKNDGTDDTDFSYIYFGNYPQSEVTDEATIQAIDSAISQGVGQAAGTAENSEGIDVLVNGIKYRRISKDDTNNSYGFDKVPNNGYRYFKWERIKWRVLQNDGSTLFVIAAKAVDCKEYNEEFVNITWENSTIRSWLNNSFYNTAFSSSEQDAIVMQNVDNPEDVVEGGNNTNDNIYLLSISEVRNETYGFCSDSSTYSMSRRMKTSDYANARGASSGNEGKCYWWLRSRIRDREDPEVVDAANVDSSGYAGRSGYSVYFNNGGVCPALHINLSSGIWSMAERGEIINLQAVKRRKVYEQGEKLNLDDFTVAAVYEDSEQILAKDSYIINTSEVNMNTPGNYKLEISYKQMDVTARASVAITIRKKTKEGTPTNPVHYCTNMGWRTGDTDYTDFSYIYFGSYPQSEVTDEVVQKAIDKAIDETVTISDNSADVGTDVWVNGTKYRRISKNDTNYKEYFDEVSNNGYRYFKWEQIKWRVLQNNGSTLFVVADKAIDCKDYNEGDASNVWEKSTWEKSTIRSWLNTSFYNTAFSSSEQSAIITQNVVNDGNPFLGTEGGNNTNDNIYLLSISEVTNETYQFCSDDGTDSMSRRMKTSDYANARGTWKDEECNCNWYLRTHSGVFFKDGKYIYACGAVSPEETYSNGGICPALHINLSSDTWSEATSNEGEKENNLISLQASKTKKIYEQGEKLDLDDLTVTAVYEDFKQILTKDSYVVNTSGIDMNTPGNYELEISYTEKNVTRKTVITITVKEKTGEDTRQPDSGNQNQPIKVRKLTITAPSKKLVADQKVKLTLKVEPENASEKSVVWETSNKKYATIDKNGKLSLKKTGIGKTVTVTATAKDGSGKKATIKIKIMKHAVKSIKLKASSKTLKAGRSMTVKATVNTTGKSVNKTLKWQSSNTRYATVNKKGKVTAKKAGKGKTVTITAASTDGSNKKAKVKIRIK